MSYIYPKLNKRFFYGTEFFCFSFTPKQSKEDEKDEKEDGE